MANEDRWRDDRERYRYRGQDEDRWGEDRGRYGNEADWRGGQRGYGGQSSWSGEGYRREGSEDRMSYGREWSRNLQGDEDRDRDRSGMWGRGDEGRGYRREGGRSYSREDYGASGYGGGYGRDYYGRGREGRGDVGSQRSYGDDIGSEAYGQGFSGNQGRGFGYGSDYGRGGEGRYGGGDYGREGYGAREGRGQDRGFWERASDEVASWFGNRDAERRRMEDYRGRGPKGYRRSDDRIREDVNDRLSDDPYVDASDIEVSVSNGEVTLTGTVDSRQARRRAEDIAESVSGVAHVQNNIRVSQSGQMAGSASTSTGTGKSGTTGSPGAVVGTAGSGGAATLDIGRSESDQQRSGR